jgi:predicted porin
MNPISSSQDAAPRYASGMGHPATGTTAGAASAADAVKVYGKGDTAVRALDGVTVGFGGGAFSAIMGPRARGSPP